MHWLASLLGVRYRPGIDLVAGIYEAPIVIPV
jgi:hypothetical protein